MKSHTIFDEGPFWDAHNNATQFGLGLYFVQCMGQSLLERERAHKEYEAALLLQDQQIIAEKQAQLEYCEWMLLLAGHLRESEEML